MSLLTLGINHVTAPVEVRERVTFASEHLPATLAQLLELPGVDEVSVLSTCNRTEVLCWQQGQSGELQLPEWLSRRHRFDPDHLRPYLYLYRDSEAVRHTLRVACGLDSMVLGEPQILGQLKAAYQHALENHSLGRYLSRLFQHTFAAAKQVRTETAIGSSPVSVAFAAVRLAEQIFGDLQPYTALLIGAGETIELAARHLIRKKIGRMIIANRTLERAEMLAEQFGANALALPDLPDVLPQADIVISSTASPLPILGKGMVERALKARKRRPIFMVDIAVPRDIEPEVGNLDDIYLYTVDNLHDVIQENLESRREAARQAEELIDVQVESFMCWLESQDAVHTIRAYRDKGAATRDRVLREARRQLQIGKPAEDVMHYLANTLTNKLLHDATSALNEAARGGRHELLEAAKEIFKLNGNNDGNSAT
ncbi:MAG: glutamyl-tRNA reductase [Thiotrichales bacterium]